MSASRPYPFASLPRLRAADVSLLRLAARRLPRPEAGRLGALVAEALGATLAAHHASIDACARTARHRHLTEPLVAAAISPPGLAQAAVVVEIEPRLALCIIDRALGGEAGEAVGAPVTPLTDAERGVLAYVVGRALAESSPGGWTLSAILTTAAAVDVALGDEDSTVWSVDVSLARDRSRVRVWIPAGILARLDEPPPDPAVLAHQAALPVVLRASCGRARLEATEVGTLRVGDVVILDEAHVRRADEGPQGGVRLTVVGGGRTTWHCELRAGALHLQRVETGLAGGPTEGQRMDQDPTDPVLERAADAPVELAVEMARFTLALGELAALRPGEVVRTGRPLGERVILRAGERAVAIGELVDVEGEVGVRVLQLGG